MNVPAMMCSASTGLGWLASFSAVAASGPLVALQIAFALAPNSDLLGVGVAGADAVVAAAALPLGVVLLLLLLPQPAAANTSAAPANASVSGRERTANLKFIVLLI